MTALLINTNRAAKAKPITAGTMLISSSSGISSVSKPTAPKAIARAAILVVSRSHDHHMMTRLRRFHLFHQRKPDY